jgi:HAE1 family hydrophobic/amphiphilic exporter-1
MEATSLSQANLRDADLSYDDLRPILMTTMCELLGGVPLALGPGTGSEVRQSLGYAIVGGLMVSRADVVHDAGRLHLYGPRRPVARLAPPSRLRCGECPGAIGGTEIAARARGLKLSPKAQPRC